MKGHVTCRGVNLSVDGVGCMSLQPPVTTPVALRNIPSHPLVMFILTVGEARVKTFQCSIMHTGHKLSDKYSDCPNPPVGYI